MIRKLLLRIHRKPMRPDGQLDPDPFFMSQDKCYASYQIGAWTYGKPKVISWGEGAGLQIGKFCSIAEGVTILLGGEHRTDWVTTYPFNVIFEEGKSFDGHPRTKGDVSIGNDVWIGSEAFILSGVTIGDGAVIAARSVVTRDVPPYSIVAGNPARQVRLRFSETVIDALQRIRWWDWPISEITTALPLLLSSDIEAFVAKYEARMFAATSAAAQIATTSQGAEA